MQFLQPRKFQQSWLQPSRLRGIWSPNARDDSSANTATVREVFAVVGKQAFLGKRPTAVAQSADHENGRIAQGQALQQVARLKQEVRRIHRVSNDGIGTAGHHPSVRGGEAE